MTVLWVALLLGAAPAALPDMWAEQFLTKIGARVVLCPAYTHANENEPLCAQTGLSAEAFIQAFDGVRGGELEPLTSWREDHGVWLRRYRRGKRHYAIVYTTIAQTFNIQVVRLERE